MSTGFYIGRPEVVCLMIIFDKINLSELLFETLSEMIFIFFIHIELGLFILLMILSLILYILSILRIFHNTIAVWR